MAEETIPKMLRVATVTPTGSEHDTNVTNIDGTVMNVFNAQIIRALTQGFGIPFQIIMAPDDTFGSKMPNGSWSGMIGMVVRGEADLTVSGLTMNNERREVVNFTFPMYISDVSFMVTKPELYPKKFAVFDVFYREVWICVGICVLLVSYTLHMLLKRREVYPTVLVDTIGTLLEQSFSFKVRYKNTICLLITWFFTTLILVTSYKAVILSVMTFPRMVGIRDISDLAEAAKEGTIKCISYKGGYPSVAWFEANDERLEAIEECRKRTEAEGIYDTSGFRDYEGRKAFISDRLDLITYKRDYFVSEDSFILSHLGIAYSKNFCCPRKLENVVRRIVEADLYAKTLRDREYRAQLRMPKPKSDKNEGILALTFEDFSGSFIVLAIGHIFSLLIFMIEVLGRHPGKVAHNVERGEDIIGKYAEKGEDNILKHAEKGEDNIGKHEKKVSNNVGKGEESYANDVENFSDNLEKY